MMLTRPRVVTVISLALIVISSISIIVIYATNGVAIDFGSRNPSLMLVSLLASVLQLVLGFGMFYGFNWARYFFLRIIPIYILFALILGIFLGKLGLGTLFRIFWYIVFAGFLTRPKIYAYFRQRI